MRSILKAVAFALLGNSLRVRHRVRRIGRTDKLTILNLHRVCAADSSTYRPLDPKLFEQLLIFLRNNFTLLTLGELAEWWPMRATKPPLILSFDDGYKDFIEVTAPLLEKHGIKVNQNIIPACVESGQPPLNVMIQDFIGKATQTELGRLEIPGCSLDARTAERESMGWRVSHFLKNRPDAEQREIAKSVFEQLGEEMTRYATPMMTLAEISELKNVHEFGAHSYSHANLGVETDDYAAEDFRKCKDWFKKHLAMPVSIYAFPNGSYKVQHISLAQDAGFEHVLLVNDRFSEPKGSIHERFGFDARSAAEMRFKAVGGLTEIASGQ